MRELSAQYSAWWDSPLTNSAQWASFQQFQIHLLGDTLLIWVSGQESSFRILLHHSVPKENKKVTTVTWPPMVHSRQRLQLLFSLCRSQENSVLLEQGLMSALDRAGQATTKANRGCPCSCPPVFREYQSHNFLKGLIQDHWLLCHTRFARGGRMPVGRMQRCFWETELTLLELRDLWTACERNRNATSGLGDEYAN